MAVYQFDTEHAAKWGVNESIFLHNLIHWLRKNKAEGRNFQVGEDGIGRYWTYSTTRALAALYPFWKAHQVRYVIDSLKKQEVIVTGHFAQDAFDRTLWFALIDESLLQLSDLPLLPEEGEAMDDNRKAVRFAKFRKSKGETSHPDLTKSANPSADSRTSYKETNNNIAYSNTTLETLNVLGEPDVYKKLIMDAVWEVEQITGDVNSRERYVQLREICVDRNAGDAWAAALRSTQRRQKRDDLAVLDRPGAWFDSAVVRELDKRGIPVPTKAEKADAPDIRGLIGASLGLSENSSPRPGCA